jgi:hypothetical protein
VLQRHRGKPVAAPVEKDISADHEPAGSQLAQHGRRDHRSDRAFTGLGGGGGLRKIEPQANTPVVPSIVGIGLILLGAALGLLA